MATETLTCPWCRGRLRLRYVSEYVVHAASCPAAPPRPPTTTNDILAALGSKLRIPEETS